MAFFITDGFGAPINMFQITKSNIAATVLLSCQFNTINTSVSQHYQQVSPVEKNFIKFSFSENISDILPLFTIN